MTMITGQLQPSDTTKQKFAVLADEGGINATLWFGIESVILQVNETGQVVLVYDDGRDSPRKPVFMGFFREIAATQSFVQTEPDGVMTVELTHEHAWQPAGFTPHPVSGGLMPTDRCACGAVRYPYSPEVSPDSEPTEHCPWCKRRVPVSEMNTVPWGENKTRRICDRCCDESA